MTSTAATTVKKEDLVGIGLLESASVNSITDFTPRGFVEKKAVTVKKNDVFINSFICHLIFYVIFCISLFLHILIDLGLGSFIKNQFIRLIGFGKRTTFEKNPVFA